MSGRIARSSFTSKMKFNDAAALICNSGKFRYVIHPIIPQ